MRNWFDTMFSKKNFNEKFLFSTKVLDYVIVHISQFVNVFIFQEHFFFIIVQI